MLLLFEGLKHEAELEPMRSREPWKVHRKSATWICVHHFSLEDHRAFVGEVDRQRSALAWSRRRRGLKKTSAQTEIGDSVKAASRGALPESIQRDSDSWMCAAFDSFGHDLLGDRRGRNSHAG